MSSAVCGIVATKNQKIMCLSNHGDRFLNEFVEFIQKPVPMITTVDGESYKRLSCVWSVIIPLTSMDITSFV